MFESRFPKRFIVFVYVISVALIGLQCASPGAPDGETAPAGPDAKFSSSFQTTPNRIWPGASYWTNPMENWRVRDGRLECTSNKGNRNVHLLTHSLSPKPARFRISVVTGVRKHENGVPSTGTVGFQIGDRTPIDDYRARAFSRGTLNAVISVLGKLHLGDQSVSLPGNASLNTVYLQLTGTPADGNDKYDLTLTARSTSRTGRTLGTVSLNNVPAERVSGSIRLSHNPYKFASDQNGTFWFQRWRAGGPGVTSHPDRSFGPILWTMYTLSNSRSDKGYVMKMSVQMPPLGERDADEVVLQVKKDGTWSRKAVASVDSDARNAIFRVTNWPAERDVSYRVLYRTKRTDGETVRDTWSGTIRKNPDEQDVVSIADLNCQVSYSFPYEPVAQNVAEADPDMLFFAGDQLYENNGGYGIVRRPADAAIISYLRKYYMFGWAFRDLMRNRPTLSIPDDHDVFQGNIWGEGGEKLTGGGTSSRGGYIEPVRTVNAIYRSQTGHHPGVQDMEPAKRGIRVFYGDLLYGGLSLAVVADRQFKSSPREVDSGKGRPDLVVENDFDVDRLKNPKLNLLGERQLDFLSKWVRDWRGAKMKTVLSQTTFSNPMTHTGSNQRVYADLDSNGWPISGRNRALRVLRKGFAFHLAGDQHLTTLVHHGIEQQRDSIWTFVAPAVSVGWPRWFRADEVGMPVTNRPDHGLSNTGAYRDGFNNEMYVYAVGNPPVKDAPDDAPDPYRKAHRKASGFGLARFNKSKRTITTLAYKFFGGLARGQEPNLFPGWPATVSQISNYGRERIGSLPAISMEGVEEPVVKVFDQESGELVYAIRSDSPSFEPVVFEPGPYRVTYGRPEENRWKTVEDQTVQK